MRRRQSDTGAREPNREIQTGNYFGGFERADNIAGRPFKVRIFTGPWIPSFSPHLLRGLDIVYLRLP